MRKHVFGFMVIAIMFASIFAPGAHADTITGITLYGGDGGASWAGNGQVWTATTVGSWVLGVSSSAGGPLLNNPDKTVSVPFNQSYYLYAEPTYLGSTPQIVVTTQNLGTLSTIFSLNGVNGSGESWAYVSGSTQLQLGWASTTADLVGRGSQMTPDGIQDFSLHLLAGAPAPLPASMLLFGPGLVGLAALRRRFKK